MAYILDSPTSILCPHGGQASVTPSAKKVKLGGNPPLLKGDTAAISGCSFNISGSPSPCSRVQWMTAATKTKIESGEPLLSTSVGLCMSAAGAPQGKAVISGFQTKVKAQ